MPSTNTSRTVLGLANDINHSFRVAAKTDILGSWSNIAEATPYETFFIASGWRGDTGGVVRDIFVVDGDSLTLVPSGTAVPSGWVGAGEDPNLARTAFAISRNAQYMATISGGLAIYKRSERTFTKLSDPATMPTGTAQAVTMSHDGNYLVVGTNNASSPFAIYERSGDTFTKLADPDVLPPSGVTAVKISDDGAYLAALSSNTASIFVYARTGSTFSKVTDSTIAGPLSGAPRLLAMSPDATYVVATNYTWSNILAFSRSGSSFAPLSVAPFGNVADENFFSKSIGPLVFSPTGTHFAVIANGWGTRLYVYSISASGATVAGYIDAPAFSFTNVAFSADGSRIAAGVLDNDNNMSLYFYELSGNTITALPALTTALSPQPAAFYDTAFSRL